MPPAATALAVLPEPNPRLVPTPAGQAALQSVRALGRKAAAPATLRAHKADWTHYAAWYAATGFTPVPAEPATIGAYLASLKESHASTTIHRRLSAIGKMHSFNDLPWMPPTVISRSRCKACCASAAARRKWPPC